MKRSQEKYVSKVADNLFIVRILKKSEVAKKHVFGSEGLVAGVDCQTLACALAIMLLTPAILTHNGTAVKIRLRYPTKLSGQRPVSLAKNLSR